MTLIAFADVLDDLAHEISEIAESKGFWDYPEFGDAALIPLKIALIHTEVSEALEAHRKPYDDDDVSSYTNMTPMQEQDFSEELADAVIRILDVVGFYGLDDFGKIMIDKIEKNRARPYKHGKRY